MGKKASQPKKKQSLKAKPELETRGSLVFIPPEDYSTMPSLGSASFDAGWYQVKQIEEEVLTEHLLPFVLKTVPGHILLLTMLNLFPDFDYIHALHKELGDVFILWLLFNWVETRLPSIVPVMNRSIAMTYVMAYPDALSAKQRKWIKAVAKTYYSLYVVMAILPNYQLKFKDILLGEEYLVKDFHAYSFLKAGDILWSRLLIFDGQCFCLGMGPYVIPARYHLALLEYRLDCQKAPYGERMTVNNLRQYKEASRLYLDILGKQLAIDSQVSVSPAGEAFEVCRIYFLLQKEIGAVFKKNVIA